MTKSLPELAAEYLAERQPSEPKILTVDIETSPHQAYVWGLHKQEISPIQIIEPSRVLCVAAKWLHEKTTIFEWEGLDGSGHENMAVATRDLYDEADCIITYNGVNFDNGHLRRTWLEYGLQAPSPWRDIDLYLELRKFKFASHRLGFIVDKLGLGSKMDAGGMETWIRVLAGDPKAWDKFRRYNQRDVRITEQLFLMLQPWLKTPHMGGWTLDMQGCFSCGSNRLELAGFVHYAALTYPKVECMDCGVFNKVMRNGQTRPA